MSLRGASAEALRGLTDELGSTLGGSADAARVSADLFGVADLLRSEPSLRRVATDVSLAASSKQELVREILGEKVSGAAADLVADAVGRRWTSTRDLADVLEHLGVLAAVESAGSDSARLSDELFEFGQVVKDNPALRDALSDPARSREDKATMLRSLLEARSLPATLALAEQALAGSFRTVSVALAVFQQLAADVHQQKVATVRVARPLSDSDRSRLTEALTRTYDRDIHLNVVVDPDVIGGIRVEIGDDVIDGTVSNRLDDARRKLAG